MKHSTLSTLFVCGFAVAALSLLTAEDEKEMASSEASRLPQAILQAETAYEARQHLIEADLHRWQLSHMDQAPEVRREKMVEWMEVNRQTLEEQARFSDSIDALYVAHRVPPSPKPSEILAARAPAAGQEKTPAGRLWKCQHDLALLRETHADSPENLRKALHQWMTAHEKEMARAEAELRAELSAAFQEKRATPPTPASLSVSEIPADASEEARQLFRLQQQMDEIMARHPHPSLQNNGTPSLEECEAWRTAVAQETGELNQKLQALSQKMARQAEQTLARENPYESIN